MRPRAPLPKSTPGAFDVGFGLVAMSDSGPADCGLVPWRRGWVADLPVCGGALRPDFPSTRARHGQAGLPMPVSCAGARGCDGDDTIGRFAPGRGTRHALSVRGTPSPAAPAPRVQLTPSRRTRRGPGPASCRPGESVRDSRRGHRPRRRVRRMAAGREGVSDAGAGCVQVMYSETIDRRPSKLTTLPPRPRSADGRTLRTGPPDGPCVRACR